MAKKVKKLAPAQKELTKKERQELRKSLTEISKISAEELIEMVSKDPNGQLAVNVVLDALWPKFKKAFRVGMPAKGPGVSDAAYKKQLDEYRRWTQSIKSIARFWYCCGMLHKQNHRDIINILDAQKDAEAPEENPSDKQPESAQEK